MTWPPPTCAALRYWATPPTKCMTDGWCRRDGCPHEGEERTMTCEYCDQTHGKRCPSVKAIEYFENGQVKRVEFMTPMDYRSLSRQTIPIWDQSQRDTICSDVQLQSDRGNQ